MRDDSTPSPAKPLHEVRAQAVEHWETIYEIPKKPKTQNLMITIDRARESLSHDLPEWLEEFTENSVDDQAST